MGKRSDLAIVKDWQTIRTEFEAMERMSCVPVGIRKVRADHIFDEERSVRWNREMVEKNNADYQAEVARLNTEKNKRRDAILEDIYRLIQGGRGPRPITGQGPAPLGVCVGAGPCQRVPRRLLPPSGYGRVGEDAFELRTGGVRYVGEKGWRQGLRSHLHRSREKGDGHGNQAAACPSTHGSMRQT